MKCTNYIHMLCILDWINCWRPPFSLSNITGSVLCDKQHLPAFWFGISPLRLYSPGFIQEFAVVPSNANRNISRQFLNGSVREIHDLSFFLALKSEARNSLRGFIIITADASRAMRCVLKEYGAAAIIHTFHNDSAEFFRDPYDISLPMLYESNKTSL